MRIIKKIIMTFIGLALSIYLIERFVPGFFDFLVGIWHKIL
jgi:hypothetical protein